ncbi:o ubiquitin protein ligase E3A [Mucor ambiguus]|uniref:HECT-type E3 ubiquitin transferase n=1 Tax=Mucor ambiguus TaxID=91626 RepID=A0A0C9MW32_9FUNG|nr:o ubiquitin protein ligase E3A [Mucor ambiguus]
MSSAEEYLDLNVIQSLKSEGERIDEWTKLAEKVANVFSRTESLSSSFLQTDTNAALTCPVDKMQVQEGIHELLESSPLMKSTIVVRSKRLLHNMMRSKKQDMESKHLNIFIILFQCDFLLDDQLDTSAFPELCEAIVHLDTDLQDQLYRYLVEPTLNNDENTMHVDIIKEDYAQQFRKTLDLFQQFVRKRLLYRSPSSNATSNGFSPNSDPSVIDATKCIAALYRLNELEKYVSYTEFYNDAVNEQLEIKEDFPNFKDRKGFSFCDYPFMLNPAVKADVLKVESVFQMRHELQDAFFRALFQGVNSPYLVLEIRRDHIISDTLLQLEEKSIHDLKKQLRVQFLGEEGVDEGGVQKEFFQLIVREIFDPKYGMFTFNEESRLCWFSPNPEVDDINIREYKLVGLLLGLAVYNSVILDLHFPLALYKKVMDVDVGLQDLKQLDPSLGKGLERLLSFDGDIESEYDRSFQVDLQSFDHVFTCDLKPSGSRIQLNNENRSEFVELYADFVLSKSVENQFNAFKEGFQLVCQDSAIKIFRPEEVEQLICGSSDLDFDALETSTVYDGGWTKDSNIIKYFWEIVHSFSYEEKKKLLFFATGSDRAPIGGLSKLQFVIAKNGGDSDSEIALLEITGKLLRDDLYYYKNLVLLDTSKYSYDLGQ